jgi:3-oxoacyl-[acyl-carrier-protein] synthase-1
MQSPIVIAELAMVSCLAHSAEANAAVMCRAYSNSLPTEFYSANSKKLDLDASIEGLTTLDVERHVELAERVIKQLTETQVDLPEGLFSVFCLPQVDEVPDAEFHDAFYRLLDQKFGVERFSHQSLSAFGGRCSIVSAFDIVAKYLDEADGGQQQALVVAVDTLLTTERIAQLQAASKRPRLLDEGMPDGFIPGEAAVALLLRRPTSGKAQTCVTGIGFGLEEAVVDSDQVVTGHGLSQAIRRAAGDASLNVSDTDFRICSANGEGYFFEENALVASRVLEQKRESWPLWHPADHLGEVGAAVGGAMVVMAHYAFVKGYAPGSRALCQLSNDDRQRAAFVLERILFE